MHKGSKTQIRTFVTIAGRPSGLFNLLQGGPKK